MSNKIRTAVRAVLAGAALSLASAGAYAAGGVEPVAGKWAGGDNSVGANETITANGLKVGLITSNVHNSWSDNPKLNFSAWGHAVEWVNFQVTAANQVVTIKDQVTTGQSNRAFTVYASNGAFDGGTIYYDEAAPSMGNTPHSFNAVGQIGSPGTMWMADPSIAPTNPTVSAGLTGQGNMLRTLAYVNSGDAHNGPWPWVGPSDPRVPNSKPITVNGTDWGEVINSGVNQVDASGDYFSSVTGDFSASMAELVFTNLTPGWYSVATGGANSLLDSSSMFHALSVTTTSAVPLPGAVYLFGTALAGLVASARRKQILA